MYEQELCCAIHILVNATAACNTHMFSRRADFLDNASHQQ